jgi:hypothetical protein
MWALEVICVGHNNRHSRAKSVQRQGQVGHGPGKGMRAIEVSVGDRHIHGRGAEHVEASQFLRWRGVLATVTVSAAFLVHMGFKAGNEASACVTATGNQLCYQLCLCFAVPSFL